MATRRRAIPFVLAFFIVWTGLALAGPTAPVSPAKTILATVNGEPVSLGELMRELGAIRLENPGQNPSPMQVLERMISVRLVVQEARLIGLGELPNVKKEIDVYKRDSLRKSLFRHHVRDIKADENAVEKRYREAVKEVVIKSAVVGSEDEARRLEEEIKADGDFETLAKRLIAEGPVEATVNEQVIKYRDLHPEVESVISGMKPGDISPIVNIKQRFAIFRLEEIRYPEDPEARKQAAIIELEAKRTASLTSYVEGLKRKLVKVDEKLLESLDYESSEPGFDKLLKDKRTIATVKGEKPVTVMDLSEALRYKFFHGPESAIKAKKISKRKREMLDEILFKRVTLHEARRLKLDQTTEYKNNVEDYTRRLLFGAFLDKVIRPDIRIERSELEEYYNANIDSYKLPEAMWLQVIGFESKEDAERAIQRLREGADFQWVKAYAEGQAGRGDTAGMSGIDGKMSVVNDLPEAMQRALAGAMGGDHRLYASPEGIHYVIHIRETVPSRPIPFEQAGEAVAQKLFEIKAENAFQDWVVKLKAASIVKIRFSDEEIGGMTSGGTS